MKLDCHISTYGCINSKWIKDHNLKPETLKPLQQNPGDILQDVGVSKNFLKKTPQAQEINPRETM